MKPNRPKAGFYCRMGALTRENSAKQFNSEAFQKRTGLDLIKKPEERATIEKLYNMR